MTFEDDYVTVGDSTGRSAVKYYYSDPDMLTSSGKEVQMPESEVNFSLDSDTLNKIRISASALDILNYLSQTHKVRLDLIVDSANATSNVFSIDVEGSIPKGRVQLHYELIKNC